MINIRAIISHVTIRRERTCSLLQENQHKVTVNQRVAIFRGVEREGKDLFASSGKTTLS